MKVWLFLAACSLLGASAAAQGSPEAQHLRQRFDPAQDVGFDQHLGRKLALDTPLSDSNGASVRLGDCLAPDRPLVLAFVYYRCPMLCDLVEAGIVDALKRIPLEAGKDFSVAFVSIDPSETSEVAAAKRASLLEAYARPGAEAAWYCLTGASDAIASLTSAAGFRYVYDEAIGEYAHAGGFLVVAPDGAITHYFFGAAFEPPDLRLALVDASRGKIGSLRDRFLLLCYHWNAAAGRYGNAIMGWTRALGLVTVATIAFVIARWVLRERLRRRTA